MATLKEAQEITRKFTKDFFNLKGVYGTGTMVCDCCKKPYIHILLDKNIDKSVLNKIPNSYEGLKVVKEFGDMPVAQKLDTTAKKSHIISITPKGLNAIMNAPIIGGYIPEDVGVLLSVQNKPKTIEEIGIERKFDNLNGLIIFLHTKGLISINGQVSPNANKSNIDGDDFSNVRGRRGGGGGRRVVMVRRPRVSNPVRRHVNYVRRNYNRYYNNYPYAVGVYPPVAYYFDVENPKRIRITKKGLQYIRKKSKGVYPYFLSAIKNGMVYDEITLKNSLKLADWNRIIGWLYGNKLIDFV